MELIYRGVKYKSNSLNYSLPIKKTTLAKTAIARNPLVRYCKQLLFNQNRSIYKQNKFSYQHQSQFLEDCWQLNLVDRLDSCWKETLKIELARAMKNNTPVKLKYRGVIYYR